MSEPQNEAELKDELERVLRARFARSTWLRFKDGGWVEDYFAGRESFAALKDAAREALRYQEESRKDWQEGLAFDFTDILSEKTDAERGDERTSDLPLGEPASGDYVKAKAAAISELLAMLADGRSDVIKSRQRALGGHLLSPKEAKSMLDAPEDVSEDLRELASRLASDYVGWDEEGAVWYVLTGEAPQLRPVRIRARGKFARDYRPFQHDVTLSVLPWVPAKEVERVYRNVQQQLLAGTPRETGVRILEVAQFCWQQLRTRGPMPSWRAWCEFWNQTHPANAFKEWRNFREYALRGNKEAQPLYKIPELRLSAEKQQEIRAAQERIVKTLQGYVDQHGNRFIEAVWE